MNGSEIKTHLVRNPGCQSHYICFQAKFPMVSLATQSIEDNMVNLLLQVYSFNYCILQPVDNRYKEQKKAQT